MQLVHKIMDFKLDQLNEKERTFWAIASTEGVDRAGDEIAADGWELDNFLKNPVIPWAHDYNRPPVAKALELKMEGGDLLVKVQFPQEDEYDFAGTVFKLYKGGYLRAFSVGFAPIESQIVTRQVNGRTVTGTKYLKQELYEISCVTLPANPQALVAMSAGEPGLGQNHLSKTQSPPQPAEPPAAKQALAGLLWDRLILGRLGER